MLDFLHALPPLLLPQEMAVWDAQSIRLGIPELLLMENAARAALRILEREPLQGRRCLFFMGSGNNGGDAACLARHVYDAGAQVLVLHTRPLGLCKGAARRHVRLAQACGVNFMPVEQWLHQRRGLRSKISDAAWQEPEILVDGILGTGFTGTLGELEQDVVHAINQYQERARIYALDIPSGLHAAAGTASPFAVRAHHTVSFEAAKPGLVLPQSREWTGTVHVQPIGIPQKIQEEFPPRMWLLSESDTDAPLECMGHKGSFGHVLIIGGSPGLTGAPHLAALAALRSGAGLVSFAAPEQLCTEIRCGLPDLMHLPLGQGKWRGEYVEQIAAFLTRCSAVVLGPGLGREPETLDFCARFLALEQRPPTVIDADALYCLAQRPEIFAHLRACDIASPHPGEAGKILGIDGASVQRQRFENLRALTRRSPNVWILKGAGTLIGQDEKIIVSPYALSQLSVAGSGDVLSGCLAHLLGHRSALQAACEGVLRHAHAGMRLGQRYPQRGNCAHELAHELAAHPSAQNHRAAALRTYCLDPNPGSLHEPDLLHPF